MARHEYTPLSIDETPIIRVLFLAIRMRLLPKSLKEEQERSATQNRSAVGNPPCIHSFIHPSFAALQKVYKWSFRIKLRRKCRFTIYTFEGSPRKSFESAYLFYILFNTYNIPLKTGEAARSVKCHRLAVAIASEDAVRKFGAFKWSRSTLTVFSTETASAKIAPVPRNSLNNSKRSVSSGRQQMSYMSATSTSDRRRHVIRADVPNRLSVNYGRRRLPYKRLNGRARASAGKPRTGRQAASCFVSVTLRMDV